MFVITVAFNLYTTIREFYIEYWLSGPQRGEGKRYSANTHLGERVVKTN